MTRLDLYSHVHKAVRTLLFDAVAAVGRTDFSRAEEIPALAAQLERTIRLTRSHAAHEDREIHPLLHRLAPEVAADLEAGHDRFDGVDRELEALVARLRNAPPSARASLGRRIHELLGGLVADQLAHMLQEETRANRVLWAHATDAELAATHGRILAAIPPAELVEWLELMLVAGSFRDRSELLAGLGASVPAPSSDRSSAPARARLGAAGWESAPATEPSRPAAQDPAAPRHGAVA